MWEDPKVSKAWLTQKQTMVGRVPGDLVSTRVCLRAKSLLTLCNPRDCSPPDSSVHGILQARILEWIAFPFSSGSSPPRDQTWISCIAGRFFTNWATRLASIQSLKYSKFIPLSTVFSSRCAFRDAVRKNHFSYHERWGQGSLLPTEPSFWGLKGDVSLHFRTRKSCATLCATLLASQQPFRFTLGTPSITCLGVPLHQMLEVWDSNLWPTSANSPEPRSANCGPISPRPPWIFPSFLSSWPDSYFLF